MKRMFRAPLVIFTPKSLLRSPLATSAVSELTEGRFHPAIDDPIAQARPGEVDRLLFCSGKVYYDLVEERDRRLADEAHRVAICRVEELYPWPEEALGEIVGRYSSVSSVCWVQEEPRNMGPWFFAAPRLKSLLPEAVKLEYVGRPEAASPATGSMRIHKQQQTQLLQRALEGFPGGSDFEWPSL